MLGKESDQLINSRFCFFVTIETKPIFDLFLQKVFDTKLKGTCDVILIGKGKLPIKVNLTGNLNEREEQCIIIAMDWSVQIPVQS